MKIKIGKGDYDLKPCPFCGREDGLSLSKPEDFYWLYDKHGSATITIGCDHCSMDLYEHSFHGRDYDMKMAILVAKWNERKGGGSHAGDEV